MDGANDDRDVLRGLRLRSVLVVVLDDVGRPLSVRELVAAVHAAGFRLEGRASKVVADALRWEVARGRVQRLARGVYAGGVVPRTTKQRMRARLEATTGRGAAA